MASRRTCSDSRSAGGGAPRTKAARFRRGPSSSITRCSPTRADSRPAPSVRPTESFTNSPSAVSMPEIASLSRSGRSGADSRCITSPDSRSIRNRWSMRKRMRVLEHDLGVRGAGAPGLEAPAQAARREARLQRAVEVADQRAQRFRDRLADDRADDREQGVDDGLALLAHRAAQRAGHRFRQRARAGAGRPRGRRRSSNCGRRRGQVLAGLLQDLDALAFALEVGEARGMRRPAPPAPRPAAGP